MRSITKCLILVVIFGVFISCKQKQAALTAPPAIPMQVYEVQQQNVPLFSEYVGQTLGQSDVEITSRVDGWITSMNYQEGGQVRAGQVLYTIDPLPFQNKVDQSRGQLAEARTLLEKAKADLERIEPLAAMNAVSQRELVAAKAQYGASQGRVQSAEAAVRNAQLELGYTQIKSPLTGVIGLSKVRVGDYVGQLRSVLNTVSQISNVRVRFTMAENDLFRMYRLAKETSNNQNKIGLNRDVRMMLSDGTMYPLNGKINLADRQVDPATGALTFEASFPNPDLILRPGLYVKVLVLSEEREKALLIPQKAITEIQGQKSVFVVGDSNKVEMKLIKTGPRYGRYTIVESGLAENEKVVLGGTALLRNGVVVIPKPIDSKDSTALDITEN